MEKYPLKSLIEGLQSSSSSRIQDSLWKIKTSVISTEKGTKHFRDCGGLELLLPHLRKPNEKILDMTLSILGNICLDEKCCLAVGNLNSFGQLVDILNTVNKDSIIGRTCRLIGNLAQKQINAEALHSHGVVKSLVAVIESRDKNTSNPTLTMAVRAIRQLWMITNKRDEMLSLNAVFCVTILLITECESTGLITSSNTSIEVEGPRRSQDELINGILKCLGYFTTYSIPQCAEQLQGDGRGFQCLVALTKTNESLALKCLMNLCYQSTCRPLLGTAGFVQCLVGILKKDLDVSSWPDGAARALAQLSGESVNRSRLRHCNGLSLLVAAAKVNDYALHSLLQYIFDDASVEILIAEGLINLLTEKLTNYTTTMENCHTLSDNGKAIKDISAEQKIPIKFNAETDNNNEVDTKIMNKETRDDRKVFIERDNMIVGFVDVLCSDKSDDSDNDSTVSSKTRRGVKRGRASPKHLKKRPKLLKMAQSEWSSDLYWELRSPEPSSSQSPRIMSPDRNDLGQLSPYSDGNWSACSPEYKHTKAPRWDWSPESGISTDAGSTSPYQADYPWSPSSSNPGSPISAEDNSSDSDISGRYSPVCSEAESDVETQTHTPAISNPGLDANQVANDLEELMMDDDSDNEELTTEDNKQLVVTKSSGIMCVLVLFFRVSHGTTAPGNTEENFTSLDLLTGRECMNSLLDYVEMCKRPLGRAARIIARILSNSLWFISILKHRFVLRLYNLSKNSQHPPAKCSQCKQLLRLGLKFLDQLTIVAESSHGIGEVSYNLLKGTNEFKQTLSLTLPYIVRTEKVLKKYFIDCNALNILFLIITEAKEDMKNYVMALVKLASNVQIKDPKLLEKRFKDFVFVSYDPILDDLSQDDIVVFVLDDESTVKANKNFLCQHSDVFNVMLTGGFKESAEKCVKLKKVTKKSLEFLFTLLQCGLNNSTCDIEVIPLSDSLETNLEVLLLADRFLFDKLKGLLSSAIIQFILKPETADKIYIWSLGDGMGFLCVEGVAYLLKGEMTDEERVKLFKNILDLEYKEQLLEDIRSMILRQLVK